MKKARLFLLVFIQLCMSCAGIRLIEDRKQIEKTVPYSDYSYSIHIPYIRYVATPVDLDTVCYKREWREVYVSGTVLQSFVSAFTAGIVQPLSVEAVCKN